jgi:probable F420-dependent oxidoreductase
MNLGRFGIWTFALELQSPSDAQAAARELEELGYGAVWFPEAVNREAMANAMLLLSGTSRITVATGVANLYARDAMSMAAAHKTITDAFPDRFVLGIGVGHQLSVETMRRQTYGPPLSTMRAYLDRMDDAPFVGHLPTTEPVRLLAALGPKMLALAAERAAGALTYFVPVDHTNRAREMLGPDKVLAVEQAVVLETDPVQARAIARTHMQGYLNLPNYANNLRRRGWRDEDIEGGGSDRLVDAIVAWGTLDSVAERLRAHVDAGADHVAIQAIDQDLTAVPSRQWRELAAVLLVSDAP